MLALCPMLSHYARNDAGITGSSLFKRASIVPNIKIYEIFYLLSRECVDGNIAIFRTQLIRACIATINPYDMQLSVLLETTNLACGPALRIST